LVRLLGGQQDTVCEWKERELMGRLLLRTVIGGLFVGHGTQKLFGWFGGPGLEGSAGFMESLGLRPGRSRALAGGVAEAGGGAMLAAGLATPLAAASLISVMLTAIRKVHFKNGPWNSDGGYEYNIVLIAAALALADVGPGKWSVDTLTGRKLSGPGWALAALAAGACGSFAATASPAAAPADAAREEAVAPRESQAA
jgi:putative oxidoreductase